MLLEIAEAESQQKLQHIGDLLLLRICHAEDNHWNACNYCT
jgi:hypothetical protein